MTEFSNEDADFLGNAGIVAPLPDQVPWHPVVETLIRCGLAVTPIHLPGKGEVWAVGKRFALRNEFGLIVLPGDPPQLRLAFALDGSRVWKDEVAFLGHIGEWLEVRNGEPTDDA